MEQVRIVKEIFQSPPPARGATTEYITGDCGYRISIHAPARGGDCQCSGGWYSWPVISIHAPREGGDYDVIFLDEATQLFQSTPPARGATRRRDRRPRDLVISIHAPREGGDQSPVQGQTRHHDFNPRPPRGGRPTTRTPSKACLRISIHAPREGGRPSTLSDRKRSKRFQSTPPARGATLGIRLQAQDHQDFNPRPPRGGRPRLLW